MGKSAAIICIFHSKNTQSEAHIFSGGKQGEPETWEDYLGEFTEQYQPHVLALRKCIEDNGLIGSTGQDADDWWFEFSDGQKWTFTWRGWGDLMQAIVNKREGYITYYM